MRNGKQKLKELLLVVWLIGLLAACTQTVAAASLKTVPTNDSYPVKERTINGAAFVSNGYHSGLWNLYITKNGGTKLISKNFNGGKLLTDGKQVYYAEKKSGKFYLYRYTVSNASVKKIGCLGKPSWGVELEGYYNNKVYYTMDSPEGVFRCFNLKSKAVTKLASGYAVTSANQYGKYFLLSDGTGAGYSYLGILNAGTNKMKRIAKNPYLWNVTKKYVYYVEVKKGWLFEWPITVSVGRYTISSGKKKTLVSSLKVYGVEKFTTSYIKYKNSKGKILKKSW